MAGVMAGVTAGVIDVRGAIARVVGGGDLTADEVAEVFGIIMDGQATPAQIGGLLIALRMKGETSDEIAGAARAMRARAVPLVSPAPERTVDTCGTGGDGSGQVNVSTLAAILAAGAGLCVAKHGNRALSSRAGSADVLEVLGVRIDAEPAVVERCMAEVGIGFAFAPAFHGATRHAAGPRRELGTRTIFNLLGPLTNPAGVARQVVGVFDRRWCEPVARALGALGAARAFVVHGAGNIDEVAVRGPTVIAEWTGDEVVTHAVTPADFGLSDHDPAGLAGGDAGHNAAILRRVLRGEDVGPGGPLEAVLAAAAMTTALALELFEPRPWAARDLAAQTRRAIAVAVDGVGLDVLERWIEVSRSGGGA